jgi:hypothetical protein
MADDMLLAIERALAESPRKRQQRTAGAAPRPGAAHMLSPQVVAQKRDAERRFPWIELFVAVQFLWGALLFLPGAQSFRVVVRALPYASSLGLLGFYLFKRFGRMPRGSGLLVSALFLLALNLLHLTSQAAAGIAQCIFQACIAAPMFWVHRAVRSTRALERVLMLMFVMNLASATLGVLQVYYPDVFMPKNFSAQLSEGYLATLSYVNADGRVIFRPPGLSDQPGGAALAGGLTVLLALALTSTAKTPLRWLVSLGAGAIGLAVIYLTQVRSVLVLAIAGGALLAFLAVRHRGIAAASWILGAGGALVVAAFLWAASLGGESVEQRFTNLRNDGVLQSYQENRGHYITQTMTELLDRYPLGAGVGRWGMMNTYFGDGSEPIYVEPQLTGWLLDGGIPMWALYGGAVLLSVLIALRLTASRVAAVASLATVVAPILVFIVGLGMAGPVFNTQMGIVFWTLTAALHGARQGDELELTSEEQNSRSFEAEALPARRA